MEFGIAGGSPAYCKSETVSVKKKLLMVGDRDCGKSCIWYQIQNKIFMKSYIPTVMNQYVFHMQLKKNLVRLEVWDTGVMKGDIINQDYYLDTDVVLMCFSIGRPDTLERIAKKWSPEVKRFCPNVPIVLLGIKRDLRDDEETIQKLSTFNQAPVKKAEGQAMADNIGACAYYECSARYTEEVKEVIQAAVRASILKKKRKNIFFKLFQ